MVSHTSTGEWQSFEGRMRRRRAERLALRADVAADAGCEVEAREALEEARRLVPSLPDLDRIEWKLDHPADIDPVQALTVDRGEPAAAADIGTDDINLMATSDVAAPPAPDRRVRRLTAAAAVLAIAGTGATLALRSVNRESPLEPTREFRDGLSPIAEAPAPPTVATPPPPATQPMPISTTGTNEPDRTSDPDRMTIESPAVRESAPAPRVLPASLNVAAAPPPAPSVAPSPVPSIFADTAPPAAAPLEGVLARDAIEPPKPPAVAPLALTATPVAVSAPAEPVVAQDALVRSALDRYAAAFSALDADAAQRVWPGVNRPALARAFDSLASQHVSLESCSIEVTGAAAHARCAGTTTWQPKVGNGAVTRDRRTWTFDLARAAAGWQIVNARAQNR
jgi:hypothetical protein